MTPPRLRSINVIVRDVEAAANFLDALGVELEPTLSEWAVHHRNFGTGVSGFDADLDSPSFAAWWGGVPEGMVPGVVVNVRVDGRDDVDRLHAQALELGATELKPPWDAFWGSRYSVLLAPGQLCLGVMSDPDASRRAAPPPIGDFA